LIVDELDCVEITRLFSFGPLPMKFTNLSSTLSCSNTPCPSFLSRDCKNRNRVSRWCENLAEKKLNPRATAGSAVLQNDPESESLRYHAQRKIPQGKR
jgi:hypothetical protein